MIFSPSDIEYFLEVVRHRNLGKAAQACGVTQPSVSKALRRLEDATGVPLFDRGAHGARLTGEGQLFVEVAQRFQLQHAEMVRAAAELRARHAGLLRVGVTNPRYDSEIVRALATLMRHRPGMRLRLSIGLSDALNDSVASGELDAAFVPTYPGISFSCTQTPLHEDRMQLVARVGHPLASRGRLALADLADYPWAMPAERRASRRWVMDAFERAGVARPKIALEMDYSSEALVGLVAHTDMLCLMPSAVMRTWGDSLAALPVPALTFTRQWMLLTRPGSQPTPLLSALAQTLSARKSRKNIPIGN